MSRSILLIDDEEDFREAVKELVESEGYRCVAMASGPEALAELDAHVHHLVLTDALARKLELALEWATSLALRVAPVPVGLITGWRVRLPAGSPIRFAISKPFEPSDLMLLIAAALAAPIEQGLEAGVARAYFAALNARDWNALAALCTDDVRYVLPEGTPFSAVIEGRSAFRDYSEQTFRNFPDAHFDELSFYSTPGGVAARFASSWTGSAGKQRSAGSLMLRLAGDRISGIGVEMSPALLQSMRPG